MQVLTAEIGPERGGLEESTTGKGESDEASAASEAAATIAQGQATEAKSMGEAVKDFLTTPQVLTCQPTLPLSPLFPAPPLPFHPPLPSPRHLFVTCTHQCTSHSANTPPPPPLLRVLSVGKHQVMFVTSTTRDMQLVRIMLSSYLDIL